MSARSINPLLRRTGRALGASALALVALAGPASAQSLPDGLAAQLQQIFSEERFEAARFGPARWLEEGGSYTTLEDSDTVEGSRDLVLYSAESGSRRILVPAERLRPEGRERPLEVEDYSWSADRSRLLIFTNTRKVWRHNTRGDYWVLHGTELRQVGANLPEASLMFARFAPGGEHVGFVHRNDIYVERLGDGQTVRLTDDGSETLINGTSDWVYEEELGVRDGFRFSPDGSRVAFWRFDTEGVGVFRLINDTDTLYPEIVEIPYPKVGTTNSSVSIGVVPSSGGDPVWMKVPGDPRDSYVARMEWVDDSTLALQHLNRLQNRNDVLLADVHSGTVRTWFTDRDDAWVDVRDFAWLPGPAPSRGSDLLWLSERDGWRHAYAVGSRDAEVKLLTAFEGDVIDLVGVARQGPALDTENDALYFLASPEDATSRYLFRIPIGDPAARPRRVTPLDQPGTHGYDLSPDGRFAFHTWSRLEMPPRIELVSLPEHRVVRVLEDNGDLNSRLAGLFEPPTEFFRVEIADDVSLDAWRIEPPVSIPGPHPLLVYVYGEPAGQTVLDRWGGNRHLFHRALARQGFVVVSFDNRGTPAPRGSRWRKQVYGTIGELSARDQAAAVEALLGQRDDLDPDRVAIWGWSGGGSNTLNALFRHPEVFRVGVSVAPVPDQLLYDTIYQERYMGLPDGNAEGYGRGSPIHFAEGLAGDLLVVHGSGDDNVHYQGTERLVNRLVELGKPFDLMVYPNRSHSISEGEGTSLHLHGLIARYLLEHTGD